MRKWDFIAQLDFDEIIVPNVVYSMTSLVEYLEKKYPPFTSFYLNQHLYLADNKK